MPRDRSSANPAKLLDYAAAVSEMDGVLRAAADAVAEACSRLRLAQSLTGDLADSFNVFGGDTSYTVRVGDVDEQLSTLAADWRHLDDFANDVAEGFFTADQGAEALGKPPVSRVLTVDDSRLAEAGRIGFADRQDAIDAADEMAAELDRLWEQGHASVTEIEGFVTMASAGQHDPAFAVAFSERAGVAGYVQAATLIRYGYSAGSRSMAHVDPPLNDRQAEDAAAAWQLLGTTLTTALATRTGDTGVEEAAPGERLSREFVDDLVAYDPLSELDRYADGAQISLATDGMVDLSAVLRFTDPPTDIAVDIAEHRLTPWLAPDRHSDVASNPSTWGDYGSPMANIATMLGRNPDASAIWLHREVDPSTLWPGSEVPDGTRHIDLVLQHDESDDYISDTATALGQVVENGVTHYDDDLRRRLMNQAIETIADQGEIRSDPLYGALAQGVDANMPLIDHRINAGWDLADVGVEPSQDARETFDFLHALMADEEAADVSHRAAERYLLEQIPELPAPGLDPDGDRTDSRTVALQRLGAIQGTMLAAEGEVLVDSAEDYIARQQEKAAMVDFAVGLIPYAETGRVVVDQAVNGVATLKDLAQIEGFSVGGLFFPSDLDKLSEAQQIRRLQEFDAHANGAILLALAEHPERAGQPLRDMAPGERQAFVDWLNSGGVYDGEDLTALYTGTMRTTTALLGGA